MLDLRVVSLAVFVTSFLVSFVVFEAIKLDEGGNKEQLRLSMVPLFVATAPQKNN